MKFSWKIFFITFLIIITSFGVGGFLLINTVFTNTLNNRIDSAKRTTITSQQHFRYMQITTNPPTETGNIFVLRQ